MVLKKIESDDIVNDNIIIIKKKANMYNLENLID